MRKLEIEHPDLTGVAIRQEIERSRESRYLHRLHGVLLVAKGRSCREVAGLFGEDPRTVQRWVRRFQEQGFVGLREGERPGRPRSLDASQWAQLERDLRWSPRDLGHPQDLWDGRLLSSHLKDHYGVSLGIRQCQRVIQRIGLRARHARPQADPGNQAGTTALP